MTQHLSSHRSAILPKAAIAVAALALAFGAMAAGYNQRLKAVTLVVDGQPLAIRSNQNTVGGVLRDAGLTLYPEDRVVPALEDPVEEIDTIDIAHARPLTIRVDGQTLAVRTHAATPAELFAQYGIRINPQDALHVDGNPAGVGSGFTGAPSTPHTVSIRRAVPLTVTFDDGSSRTLLTTQATVGQALKEAGIEVYAADRLTPAANSRLTGPTSARIERSVPISVQVDGRAIRTRTRAERVGDLLAELGVPLQGQDYTQPPLDALVQPDLSVRVVRVAESFFIEQEPVAFETQILPNPDMEIDTQRLVQEGQGGVLQKRIRVRYEDGQEVGRQLEDRMLVRAPQHKIIHYGTKIVIRTIDTPSGPREYWRRFRAYATAYSAATAGTPKTAPWYGVTATGLKMRKGIVAVDPTVVPLRTELYVPNYGVGLAGDTGGGVIGRWIDLGYDDDNLVSWHQWVDVYLLTPVPPADKIKYILPDWPTFPGR
jgi:uncharacterized protein YabE (DUF348 family)